MRVRRVWINGTLVIAPDGGPGPGVVAAIDAAADLEGGDGPGLEWNLELPAESLVPIGRIVAVTVETADGRARRGRARIRVASGRVQLEATEGLTELAVPPALDATATVHRADDRRRGAR